MSKVKTINDLQELNVALKLSEGFLVTVTLKEKDELQHFILTKRFPNLDMLKSLKESKNLIVEHLENVVREDVVLIDEDDNETILDAELVEEKQGEKDAKDSK